MHENLLLKKLRRSQLALGTFIAELRNPVIAVLMANAGLDWIVIDMEHGSYDLETVADICKVARRCGIEPIVRVPDNQYHFIARALDAGATGIMVPRVEGADEVERALASMRYPPLGKRGLAVGRGNSDYLPAPLREFADHSNANLAAVVQIERIEAVEAVDQIMALEGLDVAFVGPADLTISMGAKSPDDPDVVSAIQRVIDAGQRHGVATGILTKNLGELRRWRDAGMRALCHGSDIQFLSEGARAARAALEA